MIKHLLNGMFVHRPRLDRPQAKPRAHWPQAVVVTTAAAAAAGSCTSWLSRFPLRPVRHMARDSLSGCTQLCGWLVLHVLHSPCCANPQLRITHDLPAFALYVGHLDERSDGVASLSLSV
eukprot:12404714-Karenia_brevis.AAC.1